ncbi:Uncharacterised protein [Mycobacteroides abscessus subsp. massiliense]|uniref:hypothetical protein n=1 Tax=Mycobacteroides abscessus TaxID=36809 RepID=UPI0009C9160E|nr:hypothetical protein [Mycobacteroides abscessus]SKU72003.1 Uncharacterised protein [Mycobacteroides abscessus subsp. massiliense]SKV04251.1 Uncharacterised protein [Mycobacteroides abscessus subsp. massiliense]
MTAPHITQTPAAPAEPAAPAAPEATQTPAVVEPAAPAAPAAPVAVTPAVMPPSIPVAPAAPAPVAAPAVEDDDDDDEDDEQLDSRSRRNMRRLRNENKNLRTRAKDSDTYLQRAETAELQLLCLTHGITDPADIAIVQSAATPEARKASAERLGAHLKAAAPAAPVAPVVTPPPTNRPIETLTPGASPEPPAAVDNSYPASWTPSHMRKTN